MKNKTVSSIEMLADGATGIYVPQTFAKYIDLSKFDNVDQNDIDLLLKGPEEEYYWDVWHNVLTSATYTDGKNTWTLYQDDDLFLICPELMTDQEYVDFLGELPDGYMMEADVILYFEDEILPLVVEKYGADDEVAISEAFSDYIDDLHENGEITDWLYNTIELD